MTGSTIELRGPEEEAGAWAVWLGNISLAIRLDYPDEARTLADLAEWLDNCGMRNCSFRIPHYQMTN
ncbi:MAG: hypothetical protein FJ313_03295 [Gemmatimonadetes bacterium]|nr:hypothetical protein [Gemmatimonadota bacterium]